MRYLSILFLLVFTLAANAQHFRVGTWNLENNPDNADEDASVLEVLKMMGPVSVLTVTEGDTESYVRLLALLGQAYPDTDYGAHIASYGIWYDRNAILYDRNQITFIEGLELDHDDLTRPVPFAKLYHMPSATTMYVGSVHLKSGGTAANAVSRGVEAQVISNYLQTLPSSANIILAGDFNLDNDQEAAWVNLVDNGIMYDVANQPGDWYGNPDFKWLHSQNSLYSLSRRLDIILSNQSLRDSVGLESIESTYVTLGNNGTHNLFGSITTGTGATPEQLQALSVAADHLPVLVDLVVLPELSLLTSDEDEGGPYITVAWDPTLSNADYHVESSTDLLTWTRTSISAYPAHMHTSPLNGSQFWRMTFENTSYPLN
jgi:endonuclease/exonuclease/phosphatase family metal-dependent hydrolase